MNPKKTKAMMPWLIPAGEPISLRTDLRKTLEAMQGMTPREIKAQDFGLEDFGPELEIEVPEGIAVVPLIGAITRYAGVCDWMFGGTSLERFSRDMEAAAADSTIAAIVVDGDSPGGQVAGCADQADRIREISKIKPVIAYVSGDGCSAAYWLLSACTKVVVSQTAILGCLGIQAATYDDKKALASVGIKEIAWRSSQTPRKNLDPATPEGYDAVQKLLDALANVMLTQIAGFRGVALETVLTDFGQGDVMIASEALSRGMADTIGTMDDAIALARELAQGSPTQALSTTTTAATRRIGGAMSDTKLTAADVLREHPEAAAQLVAEASAKERERVAAILKLNTAANRAVASDAIDAAISNGTGTAGELAVTILDAQNEALKKVAAARAADAEDMPEIDTPTPKTDEPGEPKIDTGAVYNRWNNVKEAK